jgi:hypothetical protein
MSGRDEQLRHLLRDADPANEAQELGTAEVARLRRTVLGAAERGPRAWMPPSTIALAFAAALAAVVFGLALWRVDLMRRREPRDDRAAASLPMQTPNRRDGGPASMAPHLSSAAGSTSAAAAAPGAASALTTSPTAARAEVAMVHRGASEGPRTAPRSSPRVIHSPAASAPVETVAAAQPPSEPQQPYQLQLTAPGGTRIVWLLSSSSGR